MSPSRFELETFREPDASDDCLADKDVPNKMHCHFGLGYGPQGNLLVTSQRWHSCSLPLWRNSLGVTFQAFTGKATADWGLDSGSLLGRVLHRCEKLSHCGLSIFGRGFASAGYVSGSLLYHLEHADLPSVTQFKTINKAIAKLVDRNLAPTASPHGRSGRFAGIAAAIMPGHPSTGGFGVIDLHKHTTARLAYWGLQLLLATGENMHPWIPIARSVLECSQASFRTRLMWLNPSDTGPYSPSGLGQPLRAMITAVLRLAPKQLSLIPREALGTWCGAVPLWGNPLFVTANGNYLDDEFSHLCLTKIRTLRDAISAHRTFKNMCERHAPHSEYRAVADEIFGHPAASGWTTWPELQSQSHALHYIHRLLTKLPGWWAWEAAPSVDAPALPLAAGVYIYVDAVAALIQQHFGWDASRAGTTQDVPISAYTVQRGYSMLLAPVVEKRKTRMAVYASLAGGGYDTDHVMQLIKDCWKLKWSNHPKKMVWRLILNGLSISSRMPGSPPVACGCTFAPPDRAHHYWDCPIAQHIVQLLTHEVHGPGAHAGQIQRYQVWLMVAPDGVNPLVWRVVCIAALNAMDAGRKCMYALLQKRTPPPSHTIITKAKACAVAGFWKLIGGYVGCGFKPVHSAIPSNHPFIGCDNSRLCVNRRGD